jgi:hypothetical protein
VAKDAAEEAEVEARAGDADLPPGTPLYAISAASIRLMGLRGALAGVVDADGDGGDSAHMVAAGGRGSELCPGVGTSRRTPERFSTLSLKGVNTSGIAPTPPRLAGNGPSSA